MAAKTADTDKNIEIETRITVKTKESKIRKRHNAECQTKRSPILSPLSLCFRNAMFLLIEALASYFISYAFIEIGHS